MFFAVEGGGIFCSSASGYSKGLTLLLSQRKKDKLMRISSCNQYQLVDQESDIEPQVASTKNRLFCRCSSFICSTCTTAAIDASTPSNGAPAKKETKPEISIINGDVDHPTSLNVNDMNKKAIRSSLKKPLLSNSASAESENDSLSHTKRKKVQWTDACGSGLVEIREYEPSEVSESDDDLDSGNGKKCSCVIM